MTIVDVYRFLKNKREGFYSYGNVGNGIIYILYTREGDKYPKYLSRIEY